MCTKILCLAVGCLLPLASSLDLSANRTAASTEAALKNMFLRSEKTHQLSMDKIMKSMSVKHAVQVLQKDQVAKSQEFQQVVRLVGDDKDSLDGRQAEAQSFLRKGKKQPAGYSGLTGARKMLNDMIYESLSKYDAEIARCTDYYSKQCALMETARGEIAAANYVAANSRMLILDAQANINACEEDIPETKMELKLHNAKCAAELRKLNARLKIVMGDIAIMTMILKMTDCNKAFAQMKELALQNCRDPCHKTSFVSFTHTGLQAQVSKLESSISKTLMNSVFADVFDGVESLNNFAQQSQNSVAQEDQEPIINKTQFNNPPVPRTKIPGNPCTDPFKGAPSPEDKRAAKCTIKKSPQCFKLQERFLLIQAGIADERDQLTEDIAKLEDDCAETRQTLETSIANDESLLDSSQTKLAFATEKEASAGEKARVVAAENEELNSDLVKQMKKCSNNYITFETELCALKKIRGELYKMKGDGHNGFFQDCEVSKWGPEECTKQCAGGEQKLIRSVLTHPNGGTKCLPLAAMRSCNNQPCPVDCELKAWSGWSKCSADCGGGVTQRLRDVKVAMKHGGKPCSASKETKACNIKACEKDCDLSYWTKWSRCSKDCDGGTRKRTKFVTHPAEGSGKCPGTWSKKRLQYKPCNMERCRFSAKEGYTLKCKNKMDVILMIDGCPKGGKNAWDAQITAASSFVDAFYLKNKKPKAQMSVISYCGPRTWSGVSQCTGKSTKKVDMEKTCKVKIVQHLTDDAKKIKQKIMGLEMAKGMKLLSLGLLTAKAELSLGRKKADSAVVGFIDGPPLSERKTLLAAQVLRKSARLTLIPTSKLSPLKLLKKLVTRRWQENLVVVKSAKQLAKPESVTHIIADICPSKKPKMRFERDRPMELLGL
jgi:hypothetical protein